MEWEALGVFAELIGSLAVVATLIYLAIQVRQSKELSRTQSFHLAIEQLVTGAMRPEIHLLFESEHRELTRDEEIRLIPPLTAFIYGHEILFYLWKKGQIDDALWQNVWLNNGKFFRLKPLRSLLETRDGQLSKDLFELVRKDESAAA